MTASPSTMPIVAELTVLLNSPRAVGHLRSVLSPRVIRHTHLSSAISRGICDSSSVGRALASQARGREFETRLSLTKPLKRNDMTEIVVFDRNAKMVFRSVVPRLLTQSQVERELDDWRVDRANHRVQIIYTE